MRPRPARTFPATPVLYVTQLLGLALGISAKELGLDALSISADSLLSEISPRHLEEGQVIGPMGAAMRTYGRRRLSTVLASDKGGAS